MSSSAKQNQTIALGIGAAVVTVSLLYYLFSSSSKAAADNSKGSDDEPSAGSRSLGATTPTKGATAADTDKTPLVKNNNASKALHSQIEELDKKGKALFKAKQVRLFVCLLVFGHCAARVRRKSSRTFGPCCLAPTLVRSLTCIVYGSRTMFHRSLELD